MPRIVHITLTVQLPDEDEATDNEVAAAINAALDEAPPGTGPFWGEWTVGKAKAFQQA